MTIDVADLRRRAEGRDLDTVPVTKRMLREIADQLEAFGNLRSHVDWRDRVNVVLRDMAGGQQL